MSLPTDTELLTGLLVILMRTPHLARGKILQQLKPDHGWHLGDKRLKACMAATIPNAANGGYTNGENLVIWETSQEV